MNPELSGTSRSRAALQVQVCPEPMRQVGQKPVVPKQEEKSKSRHGDQVQPMAPISRQVSSDGAGLFVGLKYLPGYG